MRHATRWLTVLALLMPAAARADVDSQLSSYETETRLLGADIPKPGARNQFTTHRLTDAEVAFSLGDYDQAALMLFELATQPGPDQEPATYYLGEALYQKGDRGAARTYFDQVVASKNTASRYYQPSLQRLVEIAIAQNDATNVDIYISQLDRGPAGLYVRGKYAFSQGKLDESLGYFQDVAKGSDLELQALYYIGTTSVAKKDLARATEVFTDLIGRRPKTANDRRVIELSQLALGRIYYERDQASKSIDSYLLVDRHSDLFPDALYEVAWVYVKGKQYDKALRALELLALSEPQSTRTSTVRLLEGNLRIRKAQMVRNAEVTGAVIEGDHDDPGAEYDKAAQVFTETHDAYAPSYAALAQMVDSNANPEQFLLQIAGRSEGVFQASAQLPEAAAQYLREEPAVQRAVAVEIDLGDIQANLTEAESTIARLEGVFAASDTSTLYPSLAGRRSRAGQIQDELIKIRNDIGDKLAHDGGGTAETAARQQLAQQYQAIPKADQAYASRVEEENRGYDAIDATVTEVDSTLGSTQAMAVALRKYAMDPPVEGMAPMAADQKTNIETTIASVSTEAAAIETELAETQRELTLGRDLAGVGDEGVKHARELRHQLKLAQDSEFRALASGGKNRSLIALGDRATRLASDLDAIEEKINQIVAESLQQAKVQITQEREKIAGYKGELAEYETESRSLGGTILGASFKDVKAKFYDVIIRSDVGNVDVNWSQKEDADDDLKRLNLSRQRELKQLKDEFKDIIDAQTKSPGEPAKSALPPQSNVPAGSPDKGNGADARVKPGSTEPQGTQLPNVRPDATKPADKPAPKGGK